MSMEMIDNTSILSPTRGFLGSGFTHTLNPYSGCAFAGSVCGLFCYAQHDGNITRGRAVGALRGEEKRRVRLSRGLRPAETPAPRRAAGRSRSS